MNSTPALQRSALSLSGAEAGRALVECAAHWLALLDDLPPGDGHTVVMFPGLASGAKAFGPLRRQSRRLGYQAIDWGRGLNREPQGLATPPPVPTTSIYSRSDAGVAWQACTHSRPRAGVEDIEVPGSHLGMAWNPVTLRIVAERLARPAG